MPAKKSNSRRKKKGRYHRGDYVSSKMGVSYRYRSGWEEKFMAYLDSNPEVKSWTYEATVIEYISNVRTKKVRRYYPDFYVKYQNDIEEIIEIKPKRKIEQSVVKKKIEAAKQWCSDHRMTYRIITEIELKDIGLL